MQSRWTSCSKHFLLIFFRADKSVRLQHGDCCQWNSFRALLSSSCLPTVTLGTSCSAVTQRVPLLIILFIRRLEPSVSFPHFNHPAACLSRPPLIWSYLMDLRHRRVWLKSEQQTKEHCECCGTVLPCKQFRRRRSRGPWFVWAPSL